MAVMAQRKAIVAGTTNRGARPDKNSQERPAVQFWQENRLIAQKTKSRREVATACGKLI
jgi:hypothetical protein